MPYPLRAGVRQRPQKQVGSAATAVEGRSEVTRAGSEARASANGPADPQGRILTVPNAISVARLAGVPVFLWLVLGPHADGWAVALLIVAGLSDWLGGVIARAWNQQSRLGQVLDPAADRLYIAATLIGLAIRGIIPWWLVALLVARELVLGVALLVLRRHDFGPLPVSFVGTAAALSCSMRFLCCSSAPTPAPRRWPHG